MNSRFNRLLMSVTSGFSRNMGKSIIPSFNNSESLNGNMTRMKTYINNLILYDLFARNFIPHFITFLNISLDFSCQAFVNMTFRTSFTFDFLLTITEKPQDSGN